jgi:hypothetical protein
MRIELLEDVPGIGTTGEQADLNESKALELITDRKAIDVSSCAPGAKRGAVAQPIWDAQDAAAAGPQTDAQGEEQGQEEQTHTKAPRITAPKK